MKEHGFLLYYPSELVLANAKLQAKMGLGRSFASLLAVTEGFYHLGFLKEDEYLRLKEKYGTPLIQEKEKKPTLKQQKAKEEKEKLNWTLGNVIDQWELHRSKDWREKWVNIASQHPELENSTRILSLKNRVKLE